MRRLHVAAAISLILLLGIRTSQAKMMRHADTNSRRGPQVDINRYCRTNQWICVVDLTSSTPCWIRKDPNLDGLTHTEDLVGILAKACPKYAWAVIDGVHVFAPINKTESKLNFSVGPIDEHTLPGDLLDELFTSAQLPYANPVGGRGDRLGGNVAESLSELKMQAFLDSLRSTRPVFADKRLRGTFKFRREPFRESIVEASQQFGPSFWLVECNNALGTELCDSWVDDYDDLTDRGYLTPK